MSKIATRADWKTSPMPVKRVSIPLNLVFSQGEFQTLIAGRIPEEMEDKWFIFYESPWLYLHRSLTGICVYLVRFEPDGRRHRITEAFANRDPSEYGETRNSQDALLLTILLFNQVDRDSSALWELYIAGQESGDSTQ